MKIASGRLRRETKGPGRGPDRKELLRELRCRKDTSRDIAADIGWPVLLFLHVSCHAGVGGNAEGWRPEAGGHGHIT